MHWEAAEGRFEVEIRPMVGVDSNSIYVRVSRSGTGNHPSSVIVPVEFGAPSSAESGSLGRRSLRLGEIHDGP